MELTATATDGVEGSGGVVRKGCNVDGRGRVLSIIQWGRDGRDSDSMQRERWWQDGSRCGCSRQIKADFWGGGGGVVRGSVDRRRRGCLGEAMSGGREAQEGGEQWKLAVTATATAATVTATAMAQRQVPGPPRHGEADPNKADKVTMTGRYLQAATCNGPATVPRMEPGAALRDWRLSDGGQCVAAMILVREQRRRMHERFRTLMHCAFVCSAVTGGRRGGPLVVVVALPCPGLQFLSEPPTQYVRCFVLLGGLSTHQWCRRVTQQSIGPGRCSAQDWTGTEIKCGLIRPLSARRRLTSLGSEYGRQRGTDHRWGRRNPNRSDVGSKSPAEMEGPTNIAVTFEKG